MFKASVLAAMLLAIATGAHAASFDCSRARAADEKAICAHRDLNDADVKMVTLLTAEEHLVAMGQRGDLQDTQKSWLAARRQCKADVKCLTAAYDRRLGQLQKTFDAIASRGPF